jgi:hypothetical protein
MFTEDLLLKMAELTTNQRVSWTAHAAKEMLLELTRIFRFSGTWDRACLRPGRTAIGMRGKAGADKRDRRDMAVAVTYRQRGKK